MSEFTEENIKYIRKYLYDYNFFQKVRDIIEKNIPTEYLDELFVKKMDIYALYHCVQMKDYSQANIYFIDKKIQYSDIKLDKDTRGFLHLAIAYYNVHINKNEEAKNNLLECYEIWKDTDNLYEIIEVLEKLGRVLITLCLYDEVEKYSDIGIAKVKNHTLDTKLAVEYCELVVNKCKVQRYKGNTKEALGFLSEAEGILAPFRQTESEGILYEYAVIYQQYQFIYRNVGRFDLSRKYSLMDMDASKKIYAISPSRKNLRSLAISYIGVADNADTDEEKRIATIMQLL